MEYIDTLEECKVAIGNLNLTYTKATYSYKTPKGCYAFKGGPDSYWNWYGYGSYGYGWDSNCHPICKIGE
jgi:hypothetical protein